MSLMNPDADPSPKAPLRPWQVGLVSLAIGLPLGVVLSALVLPIFLSPLLFGGWVYLVARSYKFGDVLPEHLSTENKQEIWCRAAGVAIANPLAAFLAIIFGVLSDAEFPTAIHFILWIVLVVGAERFVMSQRGTSRF